MIDLFFVIFVFSRFSKSIVTVQRNPLFYEFYGRKLAEGKTKKQALIYVMRRVVNIIYSMMKNKTEYREASPLTELKAG
ncbi:putative IS110 family transposase [Paenibacillus agaridevorans]|uniref:Putative IS110 family transposase n=1 Tax=Paenibacillus agaridevorans TaxID=171404 RepID=A0A2R5EX92_9BACL|nr:putative IS110 family transposase [Paenibacillus agaridevorans]